MKVGPHTLTGKTLAAMAEALFVSEKGPPPPATVIIVANEAERLIRASTGRSRFLFRLCALLVFFGAPLYVGRLSWLSRLPVPVREEALRKMEYGPTGAALVLALKAVLCILYYEQLDRLADIGVSHPCLNNLPAPFQPLIIEGDEP